jgi:hypothetical protein
MIDKETGAYVSEDFGFCPDNLSHVWSHEDV